MARALALAERGLYTTHPNPRVGCVLVLNGTVVGEGWHQCAGEPHAETHALRTAGPQAAGATAYVTLEPCCHHGRTPPCTDALIKAGIQRVIAAMPDPNPLVSGRGFAALTAAGIEVTRGLLEKQAAALNASFIQRMRTGRPYVRCKLAMSLDGRTALADGESQWITGEAARADVQRLRAQSAAIMTGIGTVLADDPALTVRRHDLGRPDQPLRVVLDSALRLPPNARVLSEPGHLLVLTCRDDAAHSAVLAAKGAEVMVLPAAEHGVDLVAVMNELGRRGINEVLVEAGARLNGALLQAGLIDEMVIYIAPHLMGDAALGLFHVHIGTMAARIALDIVEWRAVGTDFRLTAHLDTQAD